MTVLYMEDNMLLYSMYEDINHCPHSIGPPAVGSWGGTAPSGSFACTPSDKHYRILLQSCQNFWQQPWVQEIFTLMA